MEDSEMPVFADFWSPPHSSGVLPESNSAMMGQSWSSASHPPSYFPQLRNSLQSPTSPPPLHYDSLSYPPTLVRNTITPFAPAYTNRPLPSQPTQHSQRNPSHLDLPNFPLPRPFHDVPNSARQDEDSYPVYGRDIGSSPFQLPSFDTLPSNPLTSVSRPASRLSSGSEGDFVFDLPSWPTSQTHDGFIDLTAEPSPSTMPVTTRKRPASTLQASTPSSSTPSSSAKRKRTDDGINRKTEKIEQVDLREVDDDYGLSQVLEQQRLMSIKAQQELADKPVNFSSLQCIICMESMTDITVTHCGHVFCHACLMEALLAGEQQGPDPGKGVSKCPVCRKKVVRPKDSKPSAHAIPLELKMISRSRMALKGSKASETA